MHAAQFTRSPDLGSAACCPAAVAWLALLLLLLVHGPRRRCWSSSSTCSQVSSARRLLTQLLRWRCRCLMVCRCPLHSTCWRCRCSGACRACRRAAAGAAQQYTGTLSHTQLAATGSGGSARRRSAGGASAAASCQQTHRATAQGVRGTAAAKTSRKGHTSACASSVCACVLSCCYPLVSGLDQ